MKKINFLLTAIFISSLASFILIMIFCVDYWDGYFFVKDLYNTSPTEEILSEMQTWFDFSMKFTFSCVFSFVAIIACTIIFIVVNRGGFAELKVRMAQRKELAQADKASRAESRKAAKIAKLEQELETLKKDGD